MHVNAERTGGAWIRTRGTPHDGAMRGSQGDGDEAADGALIAALRSGTPAAASDIVARFRPMLLRAARHVGSAGEPAADLADEALADAIVHLAVPGTETPGSLRAYLLRSLRNRAINAARVRERQQRWSVEASGTDGASEPQLEGAVVGCASEHSIRSSHGPAWEGPGAMAPALAALARALTTALTAEDQLLVTWLSHYVPQREIAGWLGLSYDAVEKRVQRLRARLHRVAEQYTDGLGPAERAEVLAFLRRGAADRQTSDEQVGPSKTSAATTARSL